MARDTIVIDDDDDVELEEAVARRYPSRTHARGNGDEDSDDNDDEEENEYEDDGLLVDDVDGEDEEERQKRRTKKKRVAERNYELDEDDYELLHDNKITGFHHPNQVACDLSLLFSFKSNGVGATLAFVDHSSDSKRLKRGQMKGILVMEEVEEQLKSSSNIIYLNHCLKILLKKRKQRD